MNRERNPELTFVGELMWLELRFHEEKPVVNFILSRTPDRYDKREKRRVPRETLLMPCCVWGDKAMKLYEGSQVGDNLVVVGELKAFTFGKRYKVELWCSEVALSFR